MVSDNEKVVLVGQAPGRGYVPGEMPLMGRCGERLARLAGIELMRLPEVFELRNLIDYYPGSSGGKGDAFPMDVALERASVLRREFRGRRVVFLGHKVARAFGVGVGQGGMMTWLKATHLPFQFAVMPHPSGVNRWWNIRRNKVAASKFMRSLLKF